MDKLAKSGVAREDVTIVNRVGTYLQFLDFHYIICTLIDLMGCQN